MSFLLVRFLWTSKENEQEKSSKKKATVWPLSIL